MPFVLAARIIYMNADTKKTQHAAVQFLQVIKLDRSLQKINSHFISDPDLFIGERKYARESLVASWLSSRYSDI